MTAQKKPQQWESNTNTQTKTSNDKNQSAQQKTGQPGQYGQSDKVQQGGMKEELRSNNNSQDPRRSQDIPRADNK